MTSTPRRAISAATTKAELAKHISERDELERAATEEMYERIKRPIWRRLVFLVGDEGQASDLLQEAYTRYWSHAPKLDPDTNVEAWVNRVATNLFVDDYRKFGKTAKLTTSLSYTPGELEGNARSEMQFIEQALAVTDMEDHVCLRIDLRDALYKLNDFDRNLVVLHKMSGYSQRELAQMFNMKEDAINKRIGRAVVKLYEYLQLKGWQLSTTKKERGLSL
jgi:RNA polymerase sigma-70 factor (ECF subfamily)